MLVETLSVLGCLCILVGGYFFGEYIYREDLEDCPKLTPNKGIRWLGGCVCLFTAIVVLGSCIYMVYTAWHSFFSYIISSR